MNLNYCPNGVLFRENETVPWSKLDADSYEIGYPPGQCYVGYEVKFTVTIREYLVDCDRDRNQRCVTPFTIRAYADKQVSGSLRTSSGRKLTKLLNFFSTGYPTIIDSDGTTRNLTEDWKVSGRINIVGTLASGSSAQYNRDVGFYIRSSDNQSYDPVSGKQFNNRNFLSGSLVATSYTSLIPEPANCVKNCQFTAYKNGIQVYSQIKANCPLVMCTNQECPPNTCEVECGNIVCCYNSQGISVSNYSKA